MATIPRNEAFDALPTTERCKLLIKYAAKVMNVDTEDESFDILDIFAANSMGKMKEDEIEDLRQQLFNSKENCERLLEKNWIVEPDIYAMVYGDFK